MKKYSSLLVLGAYVFIQLLIGGMQTVRADVGGGVACTNAQDFCVERICSGNYDPDTYDSCMQNNGCSDLHAPPTVGTPDCPGYQNTDSGAEGSRNTDSGAEGPTVGAPLGVKLTNPLKATTLQQLVADIIDILIQLGIPVAVFFIIYSGFLFVTARGNVEQIDKAKTTLLWTVIGTAVLLGAMIIVDALKGTIDALRS